MKNISHLLTGLLASLFFFVGYERAAAWLLGMNRAGLAAFDERATNPTVLPCNWA
jgi:hypothetical protein